MSRDVESEADEREWTTTTPGEKKIPYGLLGVGASFLLVLLLLVVSRKS